MKGTREYTYFFTLLVIEGMTYFVASAVQAERLFR